VWEAGWWDEEAYAVQREALEASRKDARESREMLDSLSKLLFTA